MSQNSMSVNIPRMVDTASSIGKSAQAIETAMDEVDRLFQKLGPDVYESDAADAFRQNYTTITPKLREDQQSLVAFQQSLLQTAEAFRKATGVS